MPPLATLSRVREKYYEFIVKVFQLPGHENIIHVPKECTTLSIGDQATMRIAFIMVKPTGNSLKFKSRI